jgi:N-methylhydantoinase B
MNTVAIGGRDPRNGRPYSYIETIGGGQGGRPMGDGDDGIQCNMTNTMNTPIEALEITYPLRVERYELRQGSSGAGKHRGGEGLVRAIRAVGGETRVSLQCERRRFAPYGLHGGADGAHGHNAVIHNDGTTEDVPGKASLTLAEGEVVVVETPGGGGWGRR